jgi:hypothetical protein
MKSKLTSYILSVVTVLLVAASLVAPAQAQSMNAVTVQNFSGYRIYHVYLSPLDSSSWGPDQLGASVLGAGYRTTLLHRFLPGYYDLKLIDEDGDACVIHGVEVIANTTWNIYHDWLLDCEFH